VDVTRDPIYKRDCGLVFQSFALFPHLTAYDNVAFPLSIRKISKASIKERVDELLKLVGLEDHEGKYPHQLSGGQQQRVGLCRALVYRPKVLLFDEPLSNLDAKLRETMRFEIREIQKKYGIASIFVTHDQQEALAISDRIAVMDRGRIVQYDTPYDVYSKPSTEFVAGFIGLTNLLHGTVTEAGEGMVRIKIGGSLWEVRVGRPLSTGRRIICSIRPKDVEIVSAEKAERLGGINLFLARVERKTFLGEIVDYRVHVEEFGGLRVITEEVLDPDVGDMISVHIPPEKCWPIEEDTREGRS